jgi:hypothetical protein
VCHLYIQRKLLPAGQVVPVSVGAPPVWQCQMPQEHLMIEDEGNSSPPVVHLVPFCWIKYLPVNEKFKENVKSR